MAAAVHQSLRGGHEAGQADFAQAVAWETFQQDAAFIRGVAAYRRHLWQRDVTEPPAIWTEGSSRLLDYGTNQDGKPILFVPSLINRAYVLDLQQGGSMMRWFAGQGVRPLLLDWGTPDEAECRFTVTDYVAGRLERLMQAAVRLTGARPVLVGYCMGGTLTVAAACRRPELISGLGLLAAPWDFHAPDDRRARQAAAMLPLLEPIMALRSVLPVDVLQSLFVMADPWNVADKYRKFAHVDQEGDRAKRFVALEDWLNDGVPLAAEVARTCLREWYGENAPARRAWRVAGLPVDPGTIPVPAFVAVPGEDKIVPPESALPLANLIPSAVLHKPAAGHIGMAAGARAERELWRPLLGWLKGLNAVP